MNSTLSLPKSKSHQNPKNLQKYISDWDWDYEEKETKGTKTEAEDQGNVSDYIEVDEPKEESIPKVSLNPLPPERLMPRTSEEREKSSEPGQDEVFF